MKINKTDLQNIAIDHSADIDYKDFINIYRECTRKSFNFLAIDTNVTSEQSSKIQKKFVRLFIKMTVTDQLKIIDNKIKENQTQYDLDRLAAKKSAYSSDDLKKYQYLTGKDLGYTRGVLEQTKFDHSPQGEVVNKGFDDKDGQKEGLLKRLKKFEKNQNVSDNDKNKKTNIESEPNSPRSKSSIYLTPSSSGRSKPSQKTLISDDKLERSAYFPDVANAKGINILELKNETQTSYLEDDLEVFFLDCPDIFHLDLKEFFENIASEEKHSIGYKLISR